LIAIKEQLFKLCVQYVDQRITTAKDAIRTAQTSANDETKSSAGDKYETGRAMMQLEIEKNTVQLNEALKLKQFLDKIDPLRKTEKIQNGSIVITNQESFYIAISAGQLKIDDLVYFAIAPTSPLGAKLIGLKAGSAFAFNNKNYQIKEVW
jgi:hypothetical protein